MNTSYTDNTLCPVCHKKRHSCTCGKREGEPMKAGELLKEANGILRSVNSIIERKGEITNWEGIDKKVKEALEKQHKYLSAPAGKEGHTCVFCGDKCYPAPTKRGWTQINHEKGLHFDCAQKVVDNGKSINLAEQIQPAPSENSLREENKILSSKVDFYREQTDKVRHLVFGRNDIGEPCQPLYDAIYDKIIQQKDEIERLKKLAKDAFYYGIEKAGEHYSPEIYWMGFREANDL